MGTAEDEWVGVRRVQRIRISDVLLPRKRITRKVEVSSESSSHPPAGPGAVTTTTCWKVRNINKDSADSDTAGMIPLQTAPLEIGRQLVHGVFKPSESIDWNCGMYRVAFSLLLENADRLSHVGWQTAVRLWRQRDVSSGVFPQAQLAEGRNVVDLHYRSSSESHSVATAKVCVFCALVDILARPPPSGFTSGGPSSSGNTGRYSKAGSGCSGFSSGGRVRSFDLTSSSRSTRGPEGEKEEPAQKPESNMGQSLSSRLVRLVIITGRGEYRLRRTVVEFVNALEPLLGLAQANLTLVSEGRIHYDLYRKA